MSKKYTLPFIFSLFLSFLLILSLGNDREEAAEEVPHYGGVFRLKSFSNNFNTEIDPVKANSSIFLSEQIFDGLIKLDKNFNIIPSLAEYWEISPDGKKYTFYLRKGVQFHNGRELTAADVKFSLERILDTKTNSSFYDYFLSKVVGAENFRNGKSNEVIGIKIRDTHTLELQWTRPYVSALYLLSMHFCKILPQDLVLDLGSSFFKKPIGTGAFQFDSFMFDNKMNPIGIRLKRNENYFLGKPYLDAVEFCPYFTLDQFQNVEIDSIPVVSERLLSPEYKVYQDNSIHLFFLGMSSNIAPLDLDIVRRAISLLIDKTEIIQKAHDVRFYGKITDNFIPSILPGFFPLNTDETHDLEKARNLLQEAGYGKSHSFPVLTFFLSLPKTETKTEIYREIKRQLSELGIQLRLKYIEEVGEIRLYENPYLFIAGLLMSMPDPEDIIRPLFYSKSDLKGLGYKSDRLDNLLEQAEIEPSWTKRINLFHKIEQILLSEIPAIPLFFQQNQVAMQPYVRGVEMHPLGFYYLETRKIWLDK